MDDRSFHKAIERSYPACLRFAKSLTRNADLAGDVVQEAVLAALTSTSRPNDPDKVQSWMMSVVKNRALSAGRGLGQDRRKADGLKAVAEVFGTDHTPSAEALLEAREALGRATPEQAARLHAETGGHRWHKPIADLGVRNRLRRHMDALTGPQRDAVRMLVIEELALRPSAEALGIDQSTLRHRLRCAIRRAERAEQGLLTPPKAQSKWKSFHLAGITEEARAALLRHMPAFTERQRAVVQACIVDGIPPRHAAKGLGISQTGVRQHLAFAATKAARLDGGVVTLNGLCPESAARLVALYRTLLETQPNWLTPTKQQVIEAVIATGGNKTRAAARLGWGSGRLFNQTSEIARHVEGTYKRRPSRPTRASAVERWPILKRGTLGAFTPANSNSTHRHTQAAE